MKYLVVEPFTLETSQGKVILPAGKILELSLEQAARLMGKIELIQLPNGGRDLPQYCENGDCWCSSKFPPELNPTTCQHCEPMDTKKRQQHQKWRNGDDCKN